MRIHFIFLTDLVYSNDSLHFRFTACIVAIKKKIEALNKLSGSRVLKTMAFLQSYRGK